MSVDTSKFAFPLYCHENGPENEGMTLRQWYAGMALNGLLAADYGGAWSEPVTKAFELADEMIKEGNVGG